MSAHNLYRYSHTIGFYGLGGRGFNNPVDVAIRRDGMLYVLNRAGTEIDVRMGYKRVSMCTLAEEYHGDFSSGGTGDGQIMWPVAMALDAEENVYISDEALQRISIFDKQGTFLTRWGRQGSGDGEFDRPAWPLITSKTCWWWTVATTASKNTPKTAPFSAPGGRVARGLES